MSKLRLHFCTFLLGLNQYQYNVQLSACPYYLTHNRDITHQLIKKYLWIKKNRSRH